jgi:site-specific recombinase XerC
MKLSTAIEGFRRGAVDLAKATRAGYHGDLQMLLSSIKAVGEPDSVTSFTAAAVKRYLAVLDEHGRGLATLARKLAAIRSFTAWLRSERLLQGDPLEGVKPIRPPKRLPRPYRKEDRARLMRLTLPLNEQVVRGLLYYTGVRVSPLCRIRIEHLDLTACTTREGVPVDGTITTTGKGGATTIHYVPPPLRALLDEWLLVNKQLKPYDLLLTRPTAPPGRAYSPRCIQRMTKRWGQAAGVPPPCTPHRFRHSIASDLLEQTDDVKLVQEWLGHKDLATTEIYTQLASVKKARAARMLTADWAQGYDTPEGRAERDAK